MDFLDSDCIKSFLKSKTIQTSCVTLVLIIQILLISNASGYKIATVGDISCDSSGNSTLNSIYNSHADLVLFLGDLAYEDNPQCFFEKTAPFENSSRILIAVGNHNDSGGPEMLKRILRHYDIPFEKYYSYHFLNRSGLVVVMDTEQEVGKNTPQFKFVRDTLANSTAKLKIVVSHKPFVSCKCKHSPMEDLSSSDDKFKNYQPIFKQNGVNLVLSGHNHNYQRFAPIDNITYIVNGMGGRDTYKLNNMIIPANANTTFANKFDDTNSFGFLLLTPENNALGGKFIPNDNGRIRDSFNSNIPQR